MITFNRRSYADLFNDLSQSKTVAECKVISQKLIERVDEDYIKAKDGLSVDERRAASYAKDRASRLYMAAFQAVSGVPRALVKYECAVSFKDDYARGRHLRTLKDTLAPLMSMIK